MALSSCPPCAYSPHPRPSPFRHIDATLHLVTLIRQGAARGVRDKARRGAKQALTQLNASRARVQLLSRVRHLCTGYAFVTFNENTVAARAIEKMAQRRTYSRVFGGGLVVERAPEPSDIIWENLHYSPRQQLLRQALSIAILTLLLLVSVTLLTGVNLFQSNDTFLFQGLWARTFDFINEDPSFFEFLLLQIVQNGLVIVGYVSVFILVPLLAHLIERPHTKGAREATTMLKLAFFNTGITVTAVIVMTWVPTKSNWDPDGSFKRRWYPLGMALILNTLIADIFLIQLVMDLARPQDLIRRHVLARRAKTQARMNELFACSAEGLLAFRMQLLIKILALGFSFSFAMPLLYLVLAIYGWLAQWVDRILFLRLLLPPPPTHGRLMNYVVHVVLPFAIAIHSLLAFKLFVDICGDSTAANATMVDTTNANVTCEPLDYKAACNDWSSARLVLAATAALVSLVVLAYWATMTKKLQQRRASIRSKGGVSQLLTSDVSARRFQKLYRILAQRDMVVPHAAEGDSALAARVRAGCATEAFTPPPGERTRTVLAEATDASRGNASPPHAVASMGKPAHLSIRMSEPAQLDPRGKPIPSPAALPPLTAPAWERTPSSGGAPLLLDEHTMMYIPPLTRVILDSFYKDMCNRSVDAFLWQNSPASLPDDAQAARPGIQAVLPFLFRSPSEGDPNGAFRQSPGPGAERANRPGFNALRTLPASCRLPSMPALPNPPRPSALLLQLDAIERALSLRRRRPAAPEAEGGEVGVALSIRHSAPHPTAGTPPPQSGAASFTARSSAGVEPDEDAGDLSSDDEDGMEGMEVAELAEAAKRLTQAAEHARHMLVMTLERAASSGALVERTAVEAGADQ
jgi:hypothetical protein